MHTNTRSLNLFQLLIGFLLCLGMGLPSGAYAQADNPNPPEQPVKLIFIHHSTGENWLTDGYGDLGRTLAENNYFVSDTNYGWGPDTIGDRTDIPNWTEWFRSDQTPTYMAALFSENQQHADYTRTLDDPGGENQIIMFKSCFPNSDLEGSPNDPPDPEGWLSVGHARYVYNEILPTFAANPDKLFIVITAPPLSDSTHAANARAFNNWLLNDWLNENHYTLNNVAVFDFYNILTSPESHHRFANGQIEHIVTASNTLAYPSGDDHPSIEGSRKATEEFIPLLNSFYHRWLAGAPLVPPVETSPTDTPLPTEQKPSGFPHTNTPKAFLQAVDDFETPNRLSANAWQVYWDESTATQITCAPTANMAHAGQQALQIDFDVAADSWATCNLIFAEIQNWASADGLSFYLRAGQVGQVFDVDLLAGDSEQTATYAYTIEAPPDSAKEWILITLRWQDFQRVAWEENGGTTFASPETISGIAFGFSTYPGAPNTGAIWIDDLILLTGSPAIVAPEPANTLPTATATPGQVNPPAEPTQRPPQPTSEPANSNRRPCASSLAVPLAVICAAWIARRHK